MEKETFDYIAKRVDILAVSDFSTQITKEQRLHGKTQWQPIIAMLQ